MNDDEKRRRLAAYNAASPSVRAQADQNAAIIRGLRPTNTYSTYNKPAPEYIPDVRSVQPNAPRQFKSLVASKPKPKTIFGFDVSKQLKFLGAPGETRTVGTGGDVNLDPTKFLDQFDKLNDEYKRSYVADLNKKAANDPTAASTLKTLQDTGRMKGDFGDFASGYREKFFGGLTREALRVADLALPGKNTFGLEKAANQLEDIPQFTGTGKFGEQSGSVTKGLQDVKNVVRIGGAAEQAAGKIPALANVVNRLSQGGRLSKTAASVITRLPGFAAETGVQAAQQRGSGDEANLKEAALVGAGAEIGLPVAGKVIGKGLNFLKGGAKKGTESVITKLATSNDEGAIVEQIKKLIPDVDDETAKTVGGYIAKEDDPKTIGAVLQTLDDTTKTPTPTPPTGQGDLPPLPGQPEQLSPLDQIDVPAYQRGYGEKPSLANTPNPTNPAQEAYQAEQSAARQADSVESRTFGAGLDPSNPLDNTPAYMRKTGDVLTPQRAQQVEELTKQLDAMPDEESLKSVVFNLQRNLADDMARAPSEEVKDQLLAKYQANYERAQKAVEDRAALQQQVDDIRPREPVTGTDQIEQAVAQEAPVQSGTSDAAPVSDSQPVSAPKPQEVPTTTELGQTPVKTPENASTGVSPQRAEEILPPTASDQDRAAVQQVLDGLNTAEGDWKVAAKARTQEKAARAAQGRATYEAAGGGEEGFQAKLGALKGKYTDSKYTPISVDQEVSDNLLNKIENSDLQDFEKLNTQNALRKVWGANPEAPRPHDITYIRKFFNKEFGEGSGDEIAKGIQEAIDSGTSPQEIATNIAGLPRALMATADLSGGGRQALPLGTRFPKMWANANKESIKYAFNPKYYEAEMKKIEDAADYNVISDKLKVALTGTGNGAEEQFIGAGYAEKIPLAGKVVSGSDRAYSGVQTRLRYDVAQHYIEKAGGAEQYVKRMEELYGDKADKAMATMGEVINTFTGRGGKAGGIAEKHMGTLSTTLFAPRLWAANLQRLNPGWYIRLAKDNPEAAKLALQTQGTFLATVGTVLSLAAAAGASVGLDPRSADFGKIKVGNTRYDIMGGQQQNIRYLAQMITGKKIDSTTGEVATIGDGFTAKSRKDITYDMIEGKENPLLGFATKLLGTKIDKNGDTTDEYGQPFNPILEFGKLFVPLNVQSTAETGADVGSYLKGAAMNIPGVFGVGVQTYGNTKTKDQGPGGEYTGDITPDMVTDKNGKPILDAKGKVIKVKFDKDATDLERKATMDEKRASALKDAFKNKQSKEDQALMKLSDNELQDYVDSGTIDQEKFDAIKRLQKGADNYGKEGDVPKGVVSETGKNFYKKWNTMTKKDQEAWLKEAPDDNAKSVADAVNKERVEGLEEFKPSNELSKAYAEYEKDINSHPEYTKVDKQNKAKEFQKFAYKLNFSQNSRDIYTEGGSADLKALIEDGQVDQAELDEAIKLDNDFVKSGLASAKFSKKFRAAHGYAAAPAGPGGDGDGSGGSGGGKKDDTQRAYLAALLPSEGAGGKSSPAPEFSSKRRTAGLTFKPNTPKKSGKKVSINL